jgi:hypothetical protein
MMNIDDKLCYRYDTKYVTHPIHNFLNGSDSILAAYGTLIEFVIGYLDGDEVSRMEF